jgi:hypothetical protein
MFSYSFVSRTYTLDHDRIRWSKVEVSGRHVYILRSLSMVFFPNLIPTARSAPSCMSSGVSLLLPALFSFKNLAFFDLFLPYDLFSHAPPEVITLLLMIDAQLPCVVSFPGAPWSPTPQFPITWSARNFDAILAI